MALEYIFPLSTYLTITQGFKSTHLGMDFGWSASPPEAKGQAIIAAESGTVKEAVDGYGNTWGKLPKIYGNYVTIDHGSNNFTVYGHLAKGLKVKKGQKVKKGDIIGYMGNSGYSNGMHLHFEVRVGGYTRKTHAKDPLNYLMIENDKLIISGKTLFPERIKHRQTHVGTPVAKDTSKDQLEVVTSTLNARASASLKAERLGYANKGIYNVISTKVADGYTWAEIEPGIFVAQKEGSWTKYYKAIAYYDVKFTRVKTEVKDHLSNYAKSAGVTITVTKVK